MTATDLGPVVACPVCRHGVRLHGDVGCTRGDCECSMSRADLGSATPVQAEVSVAPSGRTLELLDPACARCTHRRGRHAQQGYSVPCSRCACRNFTTEAADAPAAPPAEATPPPAVAAPAPAAPAAEAGDVAEAPRPAGPALRTPRRIDPRPAVERALVPAAVVGGGGAGEEVAADMGPAVAILEPLAAFVRTILQPGQPIPDDVTGVDDRVRDGWTLGGDGWVLVRYKGEAVVDTARGLEPDFLSERWGPLTVTAVRQQPAERCDGCGGQDPPGGCNIHCPKLKAALAEPEPQQADASPLLDPVRQQPKPEAAPMTERWQGMGTEAEPGVLSLAKQYGNAKEMRGWDAGRGNGYLQHDAEADALFARIAALVPQHPVQADDSTGNLWWIHNCGDVAAEARGEEYGPDACNACGMPGPWRPLLVAAPDGDRTPDAVDLGEALDDAVGDYEAARAKLLEVVGERDQARSEAERLRIKLNDVRDDRNRIVALGEHLRDQLRAELERLQAAAAPPYGPDPLVLRLPQVPEGATLVGHSSGNRYAFHLPSGGWCSPERGPISLGRLLTVEKEVTVEMAPPREPRTWKQIEHAPEGLRRVEVRQPDGRQFVAARRQDGHWVATIAHPDPENAELGETYTWGELLGEGDVTEVLGPEAGL